MWHGKAGVQSTDAQRAANKQIKKKEENGKPTQCWNLNVAKLFRVSELAALADNASLVWLVSCLCHEGCRGNTGDGIRFPRLMRETLLPFLMTEKHDTYQYV